MDVQTVLVDTSWLHIVWEMFLLFIKFTFLWKNVVSEKVKAHLSRVKQRNMAQIFACDFSIHKKAYLQILKIFTQTLKHPPDLHSY